jgi:hypothetical protein
VLTRGVTSVRSSTDMHPSVLGHLRRCIYAGAFTQAHPSRRRIYAGASLMPETCPECGRLFVSFRALSCHLDRYAAKVEPRCSAKCRRRRNCLMSRYLSAAHSRACLVLTLTLACCSLSRLPAAHSRACLLLTHAVNIRTNTPRTRSPCCRTCARRCA